MSFDINQIRFSGELDPTIFSDIAEQAANSINRLDKNKNNSTQIRKFYDELLMWNERVQSKRKEKEAEFKQLEPFIKMLKAKVAYAKGRKHLDESFTDIFNRCIDQANSAETLRYATLFMEAVVGYSKK